MLGLRSLRPVLLAGLMLAGCDDAAVELGDEQQLAELDDLSERFACSDLTFVAASADGSEGLFLLIDDGLVAQTLAEAQPLEVEYELADERVELRWVSGSNVYAGHCGRDNGRPWKIDAVHEAREGRVVVELAPQSEGVPLLAIELEDVLLEPLDDHDWRTKGPKALPPLRFEGLELGR